jgi:hypothetical protein
MKNQIEENNGKKERFKDSFSTAEKLFMRISFYIFILFGIVGLFVENWIAGVIYLVFVIFSQQVLLLRMFCRYCPYPYQYSTCLFMPLRNFKGIDQKQEKMPSINRHAPAIAFAGMYLIPQYWIVRNLFFFIGFWVFGLIVGLGLTLHFCGSCRHVQCPINRAAKKPYVA